ncbi:MAG TPA: serine/threonine-protein kinase [Thermoanaerobaculia bacterium]|nr:serine/threonine-protein kinase [Thermoanaerobaculia bacterium]
MKPGDTLDGRYTITDRLGAGGMGEVFKAVHTMLGSPRVIKVVHAHISTNADAKDRFLREARAATKIQHGNVATLHDFATLPDGAHYMVWEFIDGENLAERLRQRGTLPPRQAVHIAVQALRGLEAIHRAGIIHRDISPENLMITADDEVKIIDLGVAKLQDPDAVSQTRTGIFVGKLRYASPEQLGFIPEGETIDARADIYALGMVLVELLTGRPPYEAKSPHEYFLLHARDVAKTTMTPLPTELPGSAALQQVLEKALARNRNERFASAREFIQALEQIERTLPETTHAPTVMLPLDGDETMKVRQKTAVAATAVSAAAAGAPTLLTPIPSPPPAVSVQLRKGINPAYVVVMIAVVVLLAGGALFWPRTTREPILRTANTAVPPVRTPVLETTSTVAPPPAAAAPQIAEAAVTVSAAPTLSAPVVTTTRAMPKPAAPVVREREQTPPPKPRETPRPSLAPVVTYVDGHDSGLNDRAVERLREELQGTTTVALRAGGMQVQVMRALRDNFPDIQFEAHAPVVIRFDGTFDRLGRGRKRRAAVATVEKDGRTIFRYELPDETYRVGMDPAESFARVLADAMQP